MRFLSIPALLFVATVCCAADEGITASGRLDRKKVNFPAQSVAEGARATLRLLESCHSLSDGHPAAELKKAQAGDHIRLVFANPVMVRVLGEKLEVRELVLTQPLNTGVFWLWAGDRVVRCSKFEFQKEKDFVAWRNQARAAE